MPKINGPLNYEVFGDRDNPVMFFVHPNPLDSSSWFYQIAHFSNWYRCISVDLPGYGRSPTAGEGLTMAEIAGACWDVLDKEKVADKVVLVGCSVGNEMVQHMYRLRPERVSSAVVSGAGWKEYKDYCD